MKLHTRVALGLVAGVVVGAIVGPAAEVLEPLGSLFVKLIRLVIVPLVASMLIVAISGLPGRGTLGRMGARAFGFILVSLFLALAIGVGLGTALEPGTTLSPEARATLLNGQEIPTVDPDAPRPSVVDMLLAVVPANPLRAAVDGNMLQVLFVSVLLGLAVGALPEERGRPLVDLSRSIAAAMHKLVGWILELAPFGVFGIMASVVGRSGLDVLWTLGAYVGVVAMGLAVHVVVVYGLVLFFVARRKVGRFFEAAREPAMITFATCSTAAALPVSMQTMQETMGISSRVASFVLPLGAAIGRDGSAIYQAVSVLFIAQVYGASLNLSDLGTLFLIATLSSLAVASVPAASFVNLTIILTALGLPLEGAALVLGVERPLDMVRSTVNLLGHLVNSVFVDAHEERR